MNLRASIENGYETGLEDVGAFIAWRELVQNFFAQLVEDFGHFPIDGFSLLVSDDGLGIELNSADGTRVAQARTNPRRHSEFFYTDFRDIPGYPLTFDEQSKEILGRYLGISAAWKLQGEGFVTLEDFDRKMRPNLPLASTAASA